MKPVAVTIINRSTGSRLTVTAEFVRDSREPQFLRLRATALDFGQWSMDSARRLSAKGSYTAETENAR